MRVVVSGACNTYTGYGNDVLELVRALLQWGMDVYLVPTAVHPPLPRDVAAVLTKRIPSEVDLLISHKCPQELANTRTSGIYSVATVSLAWTMWEFSSLANVDALSPTNCEHGFKVLDHISTELSRFDAVLAYDEVSREALSPFHDKVSVLQGGVNTLPELNRNWSSRPFRFLMAGQLTQRKNPFAAIQAFKSLRDSGELPESELILKTNCVGLHHAMEKWCPGLKIIAEAWPEDRLFDLYRQCHVLLAPSWGEGKNRPAVQFASSGGAVVAPCVGGHAQWMSSDFAWPVQYEWSNYVDGVYGSKVDVDDLASIMLSLYKDPIGTRDKARRAARILPSMVSWSRVLERLQLLLPDLIGRRGQEVASLMVSCRRSVSSQAVDQSAVLSALDTVA